MPTRTTTKKGTKKGTKTGRKTAGRAQGSRRPSARTSGASQSRAGRRQAPQVDVEREQVEELLLQALETEVGGVEVYETALRCVDESELRDEWEKYLDQTREHERILREVLDRLGIDAERQTPGRAIVHHLGQSLVQAMEDALEADRPGEAQLVAAECVTLAETKDHLNWELIGELARVMPKEDAAVLKEAHDEVEEQEDEHLYHTMGWTRELWLQSLGLPAVLPPPEERKDVRSMVSAGRARSQRKTMVRRQR